MIYIGTDNGIYRWLSGVSWPVFHSLQDHRVVGLAAGSAGTMVALDGEGRVWETTSSGLSWRELARPSETARPTAIGLFAAKRPTMLLACAGPLELHARRVGVVLPEEVPEPLSTRALKRILPRRKTAEATATLERPKRAVAGGWKSLAVPDASLAGRLNGMHVLAVSDDQSPWFVSITGDGLWRSEDAGANWSRCAGLASNVLAVRAAGDLVLAGTDEGVWISTDAGKTWAEQSTGLGDARHVTAVEIRPGNTKQVLAGAGVASDGASIVRNALYESKDGGASWKQVSRGFPTDLESDTIIDIRHDPSAPELAIAALASGELWKTYTDGFWWEPLARQIQNARSLCVAG